jgi:hypothetical protein
MENSDDEDDIVSDQSDEEYDGSTNLIGSQIVHGNNDFEMLDYIELEENSRSSNIKPNSSGGQRYRSGRQSEEISKRSL